MWFKKDSKEQAETGEGGDASDPRRSRLATRPLAVLLPRLGELSRLASMAEALELRLTQAQEASVEEGSDFAEVDRISGEQAMLNQVLQWLSLSSKEE